LFRPRSFPALIVLAVLSGPTASVRASVWTVSPDGSGDVPTIGAALAAAVPGDVIELTAGVFQESGLVLADGVTLRSASGDPDDVIVDGGGNGRVFSGAGLDAPTRIEGITITGGDVEPPCYDAATGTYCMGGALLLLDATIELVRCTFRANHAHDNGGALTSVLSAPVLTDCRFEENTATHGAAITFVSSERNGEFPRLERCAFVSNVAAADAGAVYAYSSAPRLSRCTFRGNVAGQQGSSMFWYEAAPPPIENSIFAEGTGETPLYAGLAVPALVCCDVWGNDGGDWVGAIAGQAGADGNFSVDPRFCAPHGVDVDAASPCAPGGSACGAVGSGDVGCAATPAGAALESRSWGRVKCAYRR